MFQNLNTNVDTENLEIEEDRLGGGYLFDTDVYDAEIQIAYGVQSPSSKSCGLALILKIGDKEYKQVAINNLYAWFQSKTGDIRNEKGELCTGYKAVDSLCAIATQKLFAEQDFEEKIVNIYDKDAQKEIPQPVQAISSLSGTKVKVAIERQEINKKEKDNSGNYITITDTIEINKITKFFDFETGKTFSELKKGKEATFLQSWLEKNQGKVIQRLDKNAVASSKATTTAGKSSVGNSSAAKPAKSLFAK